MDYIEKRPWGQFEEFTQDEKTTVKVITILPEQELSLQKHEHRDEEWHILSGSGTVTIDDSASPATPGMQFTVVREHTHRAKAGPEGLKFLEIARGEFDEADIVRLADKYGRA
ncbi:MAG: phosphomannose isomerase type II C-terminal cupin domain [Patescibacteria group bacterium]